MAERRMFAKSIVTSDAFLDMPMSARCLYFTLGMFADDDGFVGNPKSIMRQCGASIDDMKILLSKRFVLGFESGVIVIKHWRINNYLRNDRHVTTTYIEELGTLTIDEKGAYTETNRTTLNSIGIPSDNQVVGTRYTEDSIGKVSIGNNNNNNNPPAPSLPEPDTKNNSIQGVDKTTAAYNGVKAHDVASVYQKRFNSINGLIKCERITVKREMAVDAILRNFSTEQIETVFDKVERSAYMHGANKYSWVVTFDWLFDLDHFAKVLEGTYDNREPKKELEKEKTFEEIHGMSRDEYEAIRKRNEELLARIDEEERRNGNN